MISIKVILKQKSKAKKSIGQMIHKAPHVRGFVVVAAVFIWIPPEINSRKKIDRLIH